MSHWDITGFTEANLDALVERLNTLVVGKVPNPRNVADDTGEPWTGKLVHYWPLTTNSDIADVVGGVENLSVVGTVNTDLEHPDVEAYSATVELYLSTEPLYYGQTLLANKTGVKYKVTLGQTTLDSDVLASGINGTTNGSGLFVLPAPIGEGVASDPVFLHLYFEEGNPAVDRSLIVKTTLVAA